MVASGFVCQVACADLLIVDNRERPFLKRSLPADAAKTAREQNHAALGVVVVELAVVDAALAVVDTALTVLE